MDRETDSPPRETASGNGLPPIFQTPQYASGEPATRAPEREEVAPPERERPAPRERERPAPRERERPAPRERERPAPRDRVAPRERVEERAAPEDRDEPADDGSDDAEARPRRRRRRGGRGRGGRGRAAGGGAAETTEHDDEVDAAPAPARRSRRRSADAADTPGVAEPEVIDGGAPTTAESQRDDAEPDADAEDAPRRRRRRRGGRGRRKASAPAAEAVEASPAPAKPARGSRSPKTLEEQVAAGGPTRGLRARSVRGRGRRQREPQVIPPRITDKLMVITEHGERDQIAVLEENVLVQHYVTRRGAHSMVGNVYLGRIQNVLPGMEAAFVDIGRGRNGVLYAGEVNYSPEDLDGKPARIENALSAGQAVMVQVTKDPMGGKGARLTAQISLPGRYLVLAPGQDVSGISRRLSEEARRRLKTILNQIRPKGDGVIVRTAAEGASEEEITRDLERLSALWDQIQKTAKRSKAPAVLYEEPELTLRVVRDLFTDEEFRELVTDSEAIHEKVLAYVRDIAPDLESKISLHRGPLSAFERHRIDEQILKALDRKVWLPSGGYLIIERTEAMTIIDVNTGKAVGKTNLEETVLNTNLEAAREAARQLRLRDIGGIIVIDFIDLLLEQNKRKVEDTMREALAIDKTRSQVFEIGPLGLMQVTRKRVSGGLVDSFSETCPTCEGRGILVHYEVS
jgi:ribonuclease E